jgi:hypothetical protein
MLTSLRQTFDIYKPLLKDLKLFHLNRMLMVVKAVRIPGGLTPP